MRPASSRAATIAAECNWTVRVGDAVRLVRADAAGAYAVAHHLARALVRDVLVEDADGAAFSLAWEGGELAARVRGDLRVPGGGAA